MAQSRRWFILAMVTVMMGSAMAGRVRADGALYGAGTATIDGVISPGEWDGAGFVDFQANTPGGGTTPARLWVMNDSQNLYLALQFDGDAPAGTSLSFEFDSNHNGYTDEGDDGIVFTEGAGFFDNYRTSQPPCPSGFLCGLYDTDDSQPGTIDGAGVFVHQGTSNLYELSHPLNSGDVGHDFALSPGESIGFSMFLRLMRDPGEWPIDVGDTYFVRYLDPISITPLPPANDPPDISQAAPSIASIWPPTKAMVAVSILGVSDPDNDPVTITITSIANNETGSADAAGVGTSTASVRADRNGKGGGRVYTISFTADDGKGGTASGAVTVNVPHDGGRGGDPVPMQH